ncbi:hypothetical protein [Nocardioides zeicaulis]|uniref:Htaa domain-containing protein n=1 Tax=Nocardioides zeicaulis TaxID=1776857 RepID=A0ABV6E6P2_9ACTN
MKASLARTVVAVGGLLALGVAAPAQAQDTRTLTGPSTGDQGVFLTYVACDGLFGAATAPVPRLNLGPYAAPMGRRSLGLVPSGSGTASGPYVRFDSLTALDTSVSVAATSGTSGVSQVLAVTPASPAGTAWSGRATLSVAPGSWSDVAPSALTYDWSLVDLASGATVSRAGSATPAAFAAEHGDGAGFVVTGFGCDGRAFNLDAISAGATRYDFEGVTLTTSAALAGPRTGDEVTVTGRVSDPGGRLTGDPLVLERRTPGGEWHADGAPVLADPDGVARAVVRVTETTELRWHRPESQYADEGWSDPVTVTVDPQPAPSGPAPAEVAPAAKK